MIMAKIINTGFQGFMVSKFQGLASPSSPDKKPGSVQSLHLAVIRPFTFATSFATDYAKATSAKESFGAQRRAVIHC